MTEASRDSNYDCKIGSTTFEICICNGKKESEWIIITFEKWNSKHIESQFKWYATQYHRLLGASPQRKKRNQWANSRLMLYPQLAGNNVVSLKSFVTSSLINFWTNDSWHHVPFRSVHIEFERDSLARNRFLLFIFARLEFQWMQMKNSTRITLIAHKMPRRNFINGQHDGQTIGKISYM